MIKISGFLAYFSIQPGLFKLGLDLLLLLFSESQSYDSVVQPFCSALGLCVILWNPLLSQVLWHLVSPLAPWNIWNIFKISRPSSHVCLTQILADITFKGATFHIFLCMWWCNHLLITLGLTTGEFVSKRIHIGWQQTGRYTMTCIYKYVYNWKLILLWFLIINGSAG